MRIGILGLQGCEEPHRRAFAALGIDASVVRYPRELAEVSGLVLPGGESSTMLKLCDAALWEALAAFGQRRPVWGVCAGCILLARTVTHPQQRSLGLVDIAVQRNGYGAQNESFVASLAVDLEPSRTLAAVFIRAPRITAVGASVRVLARWDGDPVMVAEGRHLASTFHPELAESTAVHAYFAETVRVARRVA